MTHTIYMTLTIYMILTIFHFSGKISNRSNLTSPWMTISSSPCIVEPHANLLAKNLLASFKSMSESRNKNTSYYVVKMLVWNHSCFPMICNVEE